MRLRDVFLEEFLVVGAGRVQVDSLVQLFLQERFDHAWTENWVSLQLRPGKVDKLTENEIDEVICVENVDCFDVQGTASLQKLDSLPDRTDARLEQVSEAAALHVVHKNGSVSWTILKSARFCLIESIA